MRFSRYIQEITRKKDTQIKYLIDTQRFYEAEITLADGKKFKAEARIAKKTSMPEISSLLELEGKLWEVMFSTTGSGYDQDPTQGKDVALQLFAALTEWFNNFLNKKKPEYFYFSGKSDSQMKLYGNIAKRIAKKTKYTMEKKILSSHDLFLFSKKDKK